MCGFYNFTTIYLQYFAKQLTGNEGFNDVHTEKNKSGV